MHCISTNKSRIAQITAAGPGQKYTMKEGGHDIITEYIYCLL